MPSLTISHLSNILGVAPDLETHCVGVAQTKNRRCRLPASDISGRAQATRLLDEGTRLLESGEGDIDEILEELVPLLLCRRHHQKDLEQVGQLLCEWSRKVEMFNERRLASVGFHLLSPSPAPVREVERNRGYRATQREQSTGRASVWGQAVRGPVDETAPIERLYNPRSTRVSSAPPRFHTPEQRSTAPLATAATMDHSRNHTSRVPLVSTTVLSPSDSILRFEAHRAIIDACVALERLRIEREYSGLYAQLDARLADERSRVEREDSGLSTSPSSAGPRHVSHDSSRTFENYEPRTLRFESRTRTSVPQMVSRTSGTTIGDSTRREWTIASSTRSAQARSEVETSTTTNPTRRQPSRREDVSRRHVEGECNICFLPLQDDESDTDERYVIEDSDDFSDQHEDASENSDDEDQEGSNELVWCRGQCGNNFHRECMDSWIDTFAGSERRPTCPNCRAEWVVEQ